MLLRLLNIITFGWCLLTVFAGELPRSAGEQVFTANGVVNELQREARTIVIKHEAISNYMAGMTMPFQAKNAQELKGLQQGDEVSFQLHVTETASWIEHITKTGTTVIAEKQRTDKPPVVRSKHPLLSYHFTNELGQSVSLDDFHGQALAITFFFTRCPLPEYCPRLSKNFQEASRKLAMMSGGPTNWHFLSFSFDTEFDTPALLKAYGNSYQYDQEHWSFLTGAGDKIAELAQQSGVTYELDDGTFNHNFRTLIVDAAGHLQTVFPTSGDLSDQIVAEMLKAAAVTNEPVAPGQKP